MIINENDIRQYYKILGHKKQTEVRGFYNDQTKRKFISSVEEAINFCRELDKNMNVYFGVNERKENGSHNDDVISLGIIPIDIDTVNKPATPEDLSKAQEVCEKIVNDFVTDGFQKPPYALSGNGFQIYFKIPPIEITDENRELIELKLKQFGKELIQKYSTDDVTLDNVFDLARIMRVPGTFNMKSQSYSKFINEQFIEDEKLKAHLLNVEIEKTYPKIVTDGKHKHIAFLDYCLTHELPRGERHLVIAKNMAIYLYNHPDRKLLTEQYCKIQKDSKTELDNWFKKIDREGIINFNINIGELINYTKKYNIPFSWVNTKEHKQFTKEMQKKQQEDRIAAIKNNPDYSKIQKDVINDLAARKRDSATEKLAKYILKHNHIYTTRNDDKNEVWMYKDGIYIPEGKSRISEICRQVFLEHHTGHLINNVIKKIEDDTRIDESEFFESSTKNVDEIPVMNGLFNLTTKKLEPFDPKKIFFNKLPITYDEKAKCPNIIQHLKDVLASEDDIEVMLELFGYLLYKNHFIEKAVMMVGTGRNGKGKTIDLMKRFLGAQNCCSIPLAAMTINTFRLSELFGKMANLAGDLSNSELKDTSILKQITGRDLLGAPRKFKSSIEFVNYSKQIFACNELPRVYDSSVGFWNRWIIFEFPYIFLDKTEFEDSPLKNKKRMNQEQIEKISTPEELSGLFNIAVEKLSVLRKNKMFSSSRGTGEIKQFWIRKSDSFAAFCMDHLEEDYESIIRVKDVRKTFHNYCKKHRVKGTTDMSIKKTLESEFGATRGRNYGEFGEQTFVWEGVKFKDSSIYSKYNITRASRAPTN